jgi:hypothetical protein
VKPESFQDQDEPQAKAQAFLPAILPPPPPLFPEEWRSFLMGKSRRGNGPVVPGEFGPAWKRNRRKAERLPSTAGGKGGGQTKKVFL